MTDEHDTLVSALFKAADNRGNSPEEQSASYRFTAAHGRPDEQEGFPPPVDTQRVSGHPDAADARLEPACAPHQRVCTPRSLLRQSEGVSQREFFQIYRRTDNNLLGEGSTSIVYSVVSREDSSAEGRAEILACKDILLDRHRLRCGGRTPEAICDELEIMRELKHPAIVSLRDYFIDERSAKLVLEYLPGGDLGTCLTRRGCFAEDDAREIITTVLQALRFMHSRHIVHRDIKLENILRVDESSMTNVKLVDMGMAVVLQYSSQEMSISGSPLYIAPEVLTPTSLSPTTGRRLSRYGTQADLWSCGVVLFLLLCGCPPFDPSDGIPAMFESIRAGRPKLAGNRRWGMISQGARDLVQRLLTVDPARRMTAEGALSHPWLARR